MGGQTEVMNRFSYLYRFVGVSDLEEFEFFIGGDIPLVSV